MRKLNKKEKLIILDWFLLEKQASQLKKQAEFLKKDVDYIIEEAGLKEKINIELKDKAPFYLMKSESIVFDSTKFRNEKPKLYEQYKTKTQSKLLKDYL
jgi:hypothetical protein